MKVCHMIERLLTKRTSKNLFYLFHFASVMAALAYMKIMSENNIHAMHWL